MHFCFYFLLIKESVTCFLKRIVSADFLTNEEGCYSPLKRVVSSDFHANFDVNVCFAFCLMMEAVSLVKINL